MSSDTVIRIGPQPGPQEKFLSSPADIALFGGSAGGGKTYSLLLEAARHIAVPKYGAVIFRRTFPEVTIEGGLWDESRELYTALGGTPNKAELSWHFPAGTKITFRHLQREDDVYAMQGAQIPFLGFDEVTHFLEGQFWYMLSRNRSMARVIPRMRMTCNPDADSWVKNLVEWWIDPDTGFPIPERSGVLRWFVRLNNQLFWANTPQELKESFGPEVMPKSFTFVPATVYDNPALLENNPEYVANLKALPLIEMERLLAGNWKIKAEAGKVFNRDWFPVVAASDVPRGGVEVRFWDFAGTQLKVKGRDPDYSAGVKIRRIGGRYYVLDCIAEQRAASEVEDLFIETTRADLKQAKAAGVQYAVRWEVEPGSAGIRESVRLVKKLADFDARGIPSKGDKLTRSRALAAQARVGNVYVVRKPWTETWLSHMHHIPDIAHDDIHDASAGAFNQIVQTFNVGTAPTSTSVVKL